MNMMADNSRGDRSSRSRSYHNGNNRHHSALFRDDKPSSSSLRDHNHHMPRRSSHRQYDDDHDENDDDISSVLSFQRIKDERDYDRINYARKRSNEENTKFYHQVRTSSPDRGGGGMSRGGSYYDDNYYDAFNGKSYSKDYVDADDQYRYSNDHDMQQSRSRHSRRSQESSSISYIDYNDSFHYTNDGDVRNSSRQRYNSVRSRSHSQQSKSHSPSTSGDTRVGSTIRTDIREDRSTGVSTITFDTSQLYPRRHSQQQRRQQLPIVGHDGHFVEHTKYRSNNNNSIMSKPQVPLDITVPSPEKQQEYMHKTSLHMHHHPYNGKEQKKSNSSSLVKVQYSPRRSSSTSKASSRRNVDRKRSRSSSTSKRSRSGNDTRSTKSTRSRRSNESGNSSNSRRSRSKSGSDVKEKRRGGDLTRNNAIRKLDSNGNSDQRSVRISISDRDRRQRDRRRDMMTGRATKHLLEDDKSYTYSLSSVRYDVDDEGYCMHHPEIELMRLRSDGYWSTVRKKCPECIQDDCPALMGDDGIDEGDEEHSGTYRSAIAPDSKLDESTSSRGIFNSTRLFSLHHIMSPEDIEEEEDLNRLKRRLAARAYHFPGNTWCEDWMQYISNTHTVLGLFFHHPLHPLKVQERLVILFGSVAIGLTISNLTYLYFIHNDFGANEVLFSLNSRHSKYTGIPEISVTKVMITLWTLGSFLHTVFDLTIWHIKALTLCRYGGLVNEKLARMGRVVGLFIVMVVMGLGGYAVILRATHDYKGDGSVSEEVEESIKNNEIYDVDVEDKRSFRFLLGYLVEFVLALFVYYPIAVTIVFSGVLGCDGRIPVLGGRPREVKKEQIYLQRKRESKILRALKSGGSEVNGTDATASYGRVDSFDYFDENQIM